MEKYLLQRCSIIAALWSQSVGPNGLLPRRSGDQRIIVVVERDPIERCSVSSTAEAVGVLG
jgi:hypothetical protein